MYDKDVYKNTKSLIAQRMPEYLESLTAQINSDNNLPVVINNKQRELDLIKANDRIVKKTTKVYSTEMYSVSRKIKQLQSIVDNNLVQVWYDELLDTNNTVIELKE